MAFSYSTGFVHKIFNNAANGGAGFAEIFKNGCIEVYSGSRPVSADAAATECHPKHSVPTQEGEEAEAEAAACEWEYEANDSGPGAP